MKKNTLPTKPKREREEWGGEREEKESGLSDEDRQDHENDDDNTDPLVLSREVTRPKRKVPS